MLGFLLIPHAHNHNHPACTDPHFFAFRACRASGRLPVDKQTNLRLWSCSGGVLFSWQR